ncbi:2-dehydropantoate 2-reductase [Citrifermentans bemidjiense Bem]|uniref:2-dehydropantoate 2-reductase n=1 Tax=Citrifermentans bemidjiense (strain ATCC BAA-1014 / DSM 16622 / JCM 12645 / Bem) TaxID=404380 RepID=B5EER7_CITBB|nr:ketopantoate reductase family protein [Citrifermentans bemidjiense]ACH37813.1 2-dehydropantoate 2-reductase [Citrifermentans bemidjiense Bem]
MGESTYKTTIIGAGALGAVYGSLLFNMNPDDVCFIASGERHDRLKNDGVTVNGRRYAIKVAKPEEATAADLVIVAVKHHHLDEAIADMSKAVGSQTVILSVMNGIDSEERIGAAYGMEKVLYGLSLGIDALREGGAVTYKNLGRILFGERENRESTERVRRIASLFDRAGIAHEVPPDMVRSLWFKYMINVGVNQVSALLGATYGALRNSPEARELMDTAMREVIAVAVAKKVNLSEDDIGEWYKVLATLSAEGKTSMLQDVEAGRKTEVEMLAGTVIELGGRCGIPTPVNRKLFDDLKRIESLQEG